MKLVLSFGLRRLPFIIRRMTFKMDYKIAKILLYIIQLEVLAPAPDPS